MRALPKAVPTTKTRSPGADVVSFTAPYEVPPSWQWISLPHLGTVDRGRSRHRPRNDPRLYGGPYPFIQTGDVRASQGRVTTFTQTYSEEGLAQSRLWPKGTLCITIAANIAETAILDIDACFPDSIVGFLPAKDVCNAHFVEFFIRTVKADLAAFAPATAQKNINLETLKVLHVPCPPLPEQDQIITKLNSLFARSKNAREELVRVARLIERYKQGILASAFRGDLTADWRRTNSTVSGMDFLNSEGIDCLPNDGLHRLPAGWCWVKAGALCSIKSGVTLGKKRSPDVKLVERPYLRVANVQRGWLNLEEIKTIPVTEKEASELYLQPGDVLMNEGGDRDKLGRGWVWEGQIPHCIHQNHVFRLRPKTGEVPAKYISFYANEFGQDYFLREGKQTTNLASISQSKISGLPIPISSPQEMARIVTDIESAFTRINRVAAETACALALLDRLDEATLAKAFRGELHPND